MRRIFSLVVLTFMLSVGLASATPVFIETFIGNDCAGEFGQSFSVCEAYGSPIVAKWDAESHIFTLNTDVFPLLTAAMFSVTPTGEGTGFWSYNNLGVGPALVYMAVKGGNYFDTYALNGEITNVPFSAPMNPTNGKLFGTSHVSWYDHGTTTHTTVPEPVSLGTFGIGLFGLGGLSRAWKKRE